MAHRSGFRWCTSRGDTNWLIRLASHELDARLIEVGKEAGIDFAFDRIARTPNTLNAHRLIWLADKNGVQDAVVEALFRAYFTQGWDISNHQTLSDVVVEAGLDRSKVEALLHSDQGMDAMKDAAKTPRRFRVDSVPFFIVDGTITLSGAQERNVFVEAFKQAEKIGD